MNNRQKEFFGILVLILSVFIFLSFLTYSPFETPSGLSAELARKNIMGIFGVYASYYLMKFTFGLGTFFLPLILVFCGYAFFTRKDLMSFSRLFVNLFSLGLYLNRCGIFWVIIVPFNPKKLVSAFISQLILWHKICKPFLINGEILWISRIKMKGLLAQSNR